MVPLIIQLDITTQLVLIEQ